MSCLKQEIGDAVIRMRLLLRVQRSNFLIISSSEMSETSFLLLRTEDAGSLPLGAKRL